MGWGAQQWVRATKESTYGTYDAAAAPGDIHWFRLIGGNAFTPREVPQRVVIRSADGGNRRRQVVAARKVIAGNLSTAWYPSQSQFFLDAAMTLTSNDLASYTLDFFDSVRGHRFAGGKCSTLSITSNAQQDYCATSIGWICQSRADVTLAQPADSIFPTEVPYEHIESKGHLSVGGITTTKYSSLSINLRNVLGPTWDEDQYITNLYYCGRDFDLSFRTQYVSPAMRDAFKAQTPLTILASWSRAAGLTSAFNLHTNTYVADLSDELPLDNAAYQAMTLQCFFDGGASSDVSFTVS